MSIENKAHTNPDVPGVVDGYVVDSFAYFTHQAPLMPDYMIEFQYWDHVDLGQADLVAVFKGEAERRGLDLQPMPSPAVYRDGKWQAVGKSFRQRTP